MHSLPTIDHLAGVTHLGWTLTAELDQTRDGDTIWYRAERGRERVLLDWSAFTRFEARHFALMVELGFPTRRDIGAVAPLRPADIEQLHADMATLTEFQRVGARGVMA